jgi:TetR/AcrR family transcriptional regulator, cholesterol catabolism regulator
MAAMTESRERVLEAAEQLFAERGYKAVTLRDIAAEVGIRHTSLYHHIPGGKEQLFVEVLERNLARHHVGLGRAIAGAAADIRAQLYAVADWLLSQPPMDLVRMVHSDMPAIEVGHAERLAEATYTALVGPIEGALVQARARGEIAHADLSLIAGGIFGMIESLHAIRAADLPQPRAQMAYGLIDAMLDGLRARS